MFSVQRSEVNEDKNESPFTKKWDKNIIVFLSPDEVNESFSFEVKMKKARSMCMKNPFRQYIVITMTLVLTLSCWWRSLYFRLLVPVVYKIFWKYLSLTIYRINTMVCRRWRFGCAVCNFLSVHCLNKLLLVFFWSPYISF